MGATGTAQGISAIETHHIDVVPGGERHGRVRSLFYIWFGSNLNLGGIVTGSVAIFAGNNLLWGVAAIVIGNLIGSVFMSLHAAQGPRLGVPQLIQARGQFGFHGAIIPAVIAVLMYVGFAVLTVDPSGEAMLVIGARIGSPVTTEHAWIVILCIPALVIALWGYDFIHHAQRLITYITVFLFGIILTGAIIAHGGAPFSATPFRAGPFFLAISIFVAYQVTYAVYVSDYSRYLPPDVGTKGPVLATFLGTNLSSIWAMILGAVLVTQYASLDSVMAAGQVTGGATGTLILVVAAVAAVGSTAINVYGGALALITGASSVTRLPDRTRRPVRVTAILLVWVAAVVIAVAASAHFITDYTNFLNVLAYVFLPWSVLNLLDFYVVKHGNYDVRAFGDRHGRYARDPAGWIRGGFALPASIAYLLALGAQVPFVSTAWWVSPVAQALDGADIAWIVGTIVAAAAYLLLIRMARAGTPQPPPA
jgi:purine-cytosine permease-like protein